MVRRRQRVLGWVTGVPAPLTAPPAPADEICDYFGVKIAMYFAWLGFYTSAMVYPAVFGSILYTFTESDQVRGGWEMGQIPAFLGDVSLPAPAFPFDALMP